MSISEFRLAKLLYVFDRFFDTDKSGTIEKGDFVLAVEQLCKVRGWAIGSKEFEVVKNNFLTMWEVLRKRCYKEDDERITPEEFVQLWRNPNTIDDWEQTYMNLMFDLQDTSGDNVIDEDEFASVCDSYGINPAESRTAFNLFSRRGNVKVDKKYYSELWREYFGSDNPGASGNFLFGKTNFQE